MLIHPLVIAGLLAIAFAAGFSAGRVSGWFARERKYLEDVAKAWPARPVTLHHSTHTIHGEVVDE